MVSELSAVDSNVVYAGAIVSLLSLIASVTIAFLNRETEHRLTTLEHTVFTKEDRDKLLDTCFKMNMLWEFYEKTLPQLLKNPEDLDVLLDKASLKPETLTTDERNTLITYLEAKAASDDTTRKYMALLYLKILNSRGIDKVC